MLTKNIKIIIPSLLMLFPLVASCSLSKEVEGTIKRDMETVVGAMEKSRIPTKTEGLDTVQVKDGVWLGDTSFQNKNGEELPLSLETNDGITIVGSRALTLLDIANLVSEITDIETRLDDSMLDEAVTEAKENQPTGDDVAPEWAPPEKMIVSYSGPLSSFLKKVSNRFNVWWKYDENILSFYKYQTKTFSLYYLPTTQTSEAGVEASSSGDSSSSLTMKSSSDDLHPWEEVKETLELALGDGGKISINKATGTVTVMATPTSMKKIANLIDEMNEKATRQVAISVKVLQVDLTDKDQYALDLKAVYSSLSGSYTGLNFDITGLSSTEKTVSGMGISIKDAVKKPYKHWNGSEAVMDALSEQGNVSIMTSTSVTTLNNKPAPVQVSTQSAYMASITRTTTELGFDISLEPDNYVTGFTMNVLPRILNHGRILLSFNMNIRELVALNKYSVDGTEDGESVSLPSIQTRGFTQEISLKSGSTLILSGFEKMKNTVDKKGIGGVDTSLFGKELDSERTRSILVILLSPEVLESPFSKESMMEDFN
jgi:type IVB pilus formation R64 PilN family outer membrane protein